MSLPVGAFVKVVISGREPYSGGLDAKLAGRTGIVERYKATYSGFPAYLVRFTKPIRRTRPGVGSFSVFWVPACDVQRATAARAPLIGG